MNDLPPVEMGPAQAADASIIWLHGLGADGYDFVDLVPQLGRPRTRFIFPHAPPRAITLYGGQPMRAWYDMSSLDLRYGEDEGGTRDSARAVDALIAREKKRGVPTHRIVLAGFSQGGAIALHTALRYPERLAGIMALSTYLPLRTRLATEGTPSNRDLPIFMAHGVDDPVIAYPHGRSSAQCLESLNYAVEWHEYPMVHTLCLAEVEDIRLWLARVLPAESAPSGF